MASSPMHLPMSAAEGWRVALFGASHETEVLVRNVVLWDAPRYPLPGEGAEHRP